MLSMILGEVASRSSFKWQLSLPTLAINVDGLAYPMHRPMTHSC
jgi:hypothetical protein